MTDGQLIALVDKFRGISSEKDWFEFKVDYSDPIKLGENLSGVANAACLVHEPFGYVLFGIRNSDHAVVGTTFKPEKDKFQSQALLPWLTAVLRPDVGLQWHEVIYPSGARVVIFQVNSAMGRPVTFKNTAYVRIDSHTQALDKFELKARAIWNSGEDWSAKVSSNASLRDLDEAALAKARQQFKTKNPRLADEVDTWGDGLFLDKARVTVQGSITNAALLLLGRTESSSLLSPSVAQITWFLKNDRNEDLGYEHFGPPLILEVDRVLARIRNLKVRILPQGTLFPREFDQYDNWVLHEALHNCIAHQDYSRRERINVVEFDASLRFENAGSFIPGSVERVVHDQSPPSFYRNRFLAQAMVNLNMIDTQGGGIRRMFFKQKERSFALPDYDLSDPGKVRMSLEGRVLDEAYTRLLLEETDLTLETVMLLDRVQRRRAITKAEQHHLRDLGLIEGRSPNLIIGRAVAQVTGQTARHVRERGMDTRYYLDLIMELVRTHQPVTRKEVDELLLDKLPEVMDTRQKKTRSRNLLFRLSDRGHVENIGTRGQPRYVIGSTPYPT